MRPVLATVVVALLTGTIAAQTGGDVAVDAPVPFDAWLAGVIEEADDRGFDDQLIKETLVGLEPLPRVIQEDRSQAELNPGLDRYLSTRITRPVVSRGLEMMRQHRNVLARIEDEYDVQRGSSWPSGAWKRATAGSWAGRRSSAPSPRSPGSRAAPTSSAASSSTR